MQSHPLDLWQTLQRIQHLTFSAQSNRQSNRQSKSQTGWVGTGAGSVIVTHPTENVLLFTEKGTWQTEGGTILKFFNTFRWTRSEERICLEHLRLGPNHPVFLFALAPTAPHLWESTTPHT